MKPEGITNTEWWILYRWLQEKGVIPASESKPRDKVLFQKFCAYTRCHKWGEKPLRNLIQQAAKENPYLQPRRLWPTATNPRPILKPKPIKCLPTAPFEPDPGFSIPAYRAFMKSPEWRKIRYEAFHIHGNRCLTCGASPSSGAIMHVDHVIPCSKAWSRRLDVTNLQILCEMCNMGKGGTFSDDWRG